MKKTKSKAKQYIDKNPIEQLLSIGGGVTQAGKDFSKSVINLDNWDEYLGLTDSEEKKKKHSGELIEGQELSLKEEKQEKAHVEPGIDYARQIVHAGERALSHENQEMEAQLRELMAEIKKLADSSKELQIQFKEVAVEQHSVKPGKYHKSFFSWLLSVVRVARQKVEDSGAWLTAMQSKKKSREYGSMAKKHGTGFTLSNERTVATQVG
ncbi:MAG: DUF5660 domain-containing protein [bacterium]|nr:DUF5660 domain-containing protein [bacterium]